jgi:hypothetical protein
MNFLTGAYVFCGIPARNLFPAFFPSALPFGKARRALSAVFFRSLTNCRRCIAFGSQNP